MGSSDGQEGVPLDEPGAEQHPEDPAEDRARSGDPVEVDHPPVASVDAAPPGPVHDEDQGAGPDGERDPTRCRQPPRARRMPHRDREYRGREEGRWSERPPRHPPGRERRREVRHRPRDRARRGAGQRQVQREPPPQPGRRRKQQRGERREEPRTGEGLGPGREGGAAHRRRAGLGGRISPPRPRGGTGDRGRPTSATPPRTRAPRPPRRRAHRPGPSSGPSSGS